MLEEVGDEPGNLLLLEFTLTELWQRQSYGMLTHVAYDKIGGVKNALVSYAEKVYNNLNEGEQKQTQRIFKQLVHPGKGFEDTRCIATRSNIGEELWNFVMKLANFRLVVTDERKETGDTVEIVHEALIQKWQRLQEWIKIDRKFRIWQEGLRSAMYQWEMTSYDDGTLLRGELLTKAKRYITQRPNDINSNEKRYIQESITVNNQEQVMRKVEYILLNIMGGTCGGIIGGIIGGIYKIYATNTLKDGRTFGIIFHLCK